MNDTQTLIFALAEALKNPSLSQDQQQKLLDALTSVTANKPRPALATNASSKAASKTRTQRVQLTKIFVTGTPFTDKGERLIYDLSVPQLALRVRTSKKSFVVSLWDKERRCRVSRTLGSADLLTPDEARVRAKRLIGATADGEDLRRSSSNRMLVSELITQWYVSKKNNLRTADEIVQRANDYLGALLSREVEKLTSEDVSKVHRYISTKAKKRVYRNVDGELTRLEVGAGGLPATADKWLASLAAIFEWGIGQGLVTQNPCRRIGKSYDAKGGARTRYLRGEELIRFWRELEADNDEAARDVILLLLYTGQRRGNVLAMQWQDIDLSAGLWSLGATDTKQRAAQTTPLVGQAREILARRWHDAGSKWVFSATRQSADGTLPAMSEARLRDAWSRILQRADIQNLRVHDLRHTAGSWLARLGVNTAIRQAALGHKTPDMAARYSHLEIDPVAEAMQDYATTLNDEAKKQPIKGRQYKLRAVTNG